ncbi:MAG: hypothetical protein ACYC0X_09215 [Pirellulaceae bacterium]
MKPAYRPLSILLITLGLAACPDHPQPAAAQIPLVLDHFPATGPSEKLEPQVLDFRYQPSRWQTCIGLVDDPHKTIVGDDGGLYYEYGKNGPEAYHCGQGSFGTRVLAGFVGDVEGAPVRQTLHSPRVPIVITERELGSWLWRQEAWSNQMLGAESAQPGADRVDYLALTATNRRATADAGQITLDVGATSRLVLDEARQRLLVDGKSDQVFCAFSIPCEPLASPQQAAVDEQTLIRSDASARVQKNWAAPTAECATYFQHVLVGFGQPLVFRIPVEPGGQLQVALGLIEGWHAEPGKRPLRLSVEGTAQRDVDLVREHGKNVPVVLTSTADDEDGDGTLLVEIMPVSEAEDGNTILSALWVFPADLPLNPQDILEGKRDAQALARIDADVPPNMPRPIRLTWNTGKVKGGESFEVLVAVPQGDQARRQLTCNDSLAERQRCIEYWQNVDLPYDRIVVPDGAVQDLLDACIRNIYQAREQKEGRPKFQVGPTCYRGTWAADGPFLLEAASYLGRLDEVRAGLEQQVDGDDGPGGVEFSKKSGLRLWMIWRHVQLTGDRRWLEEMWPRVEREVNQIIQYRAMTRDDPQQANFGLMPIGFGDGGLGGKHREYTNVYWTLTGLHAAIEMAELLQRPAAAQWQTEYHDYWETFDRARQRDKLVDPAGNTYVPVTMQGERPQLPQCGAWAFLQSIFPGRIFDNDDALMLGTMAMLDANQREGLIFGTGWIPDGIWNYAASFYGHAHLWLGHGPKAAATLYAFGNHASPLLCWREEQNPVGAPLSFVGDMPHNWGSAEFIRLVRHLVILERGQELHLFQGLPEAWGKSGSELRMIEVPTSFGEVSLALKVADDGRSVQLVVHPPGREQPAKLVVHLEGFGRRIAGVTIDGQRVDARPVAVDSQRSSTIMVSFE